MSLFNLTYQNCRALSEDKILNSKLVVIGAKICFLTFLYYYYYYYYLFVMPP